MGNILKMLGRQWRFMKRASGRTVFIVIVTAATYVSPGGVHAFHNGGAGFCEGCHTMHNSISPGTVTRFSPGQSSTNGGVRGWDGEPVNRGGSIGNTPSPYLLRGSDDSSTCLNCHAQKGVPYRVLSVDGNVNIDPGGDFYWLSLTVTYTSLENGTAYVIKGQDHGHNVIAKDFGLAADTNFTNAPGGTYPSSALTCTSCHDPHGQANGGTGNRQKPVSGSGSYGGTPPADTIFGNYRLLGDTHYKGNSLASYTFSNGAPMAAADNSPAYNFAETADNRHHVDYGTYMYPPYDDMSLWCENCHPWGQFAHHPVTGTAAEGVPLLYNAYIATGNLLNKTTNAAGAWLSLVPFERIISRPSQLNGENTSGPTPSVPGFPSCLTCHRAHASAFDWSTRWDTRATFLVNSVPGPVYDAALEHSPYGAYIVNAPYYGRDIKTVFGKYQRQLCNKCHVLDFNDKTGYLPSLY